MVSESVAIELDEEGCPQEESKMAARYPVLKREKTIFFIRLLIGI
jgi:hypothetical protein